ncbi:MAG: stage V sporulation protein S [Candidatus Riflebacteria bacterium]|jgi:stage V sporulation protein S|nr:stage V sporulation protein S [bacterium]
MEILRVASSSNPKSVAGAIIAILEQTGELALLAVGAGAVNQSVKAIAIARSYMITRNISLAAKISFARTFIDGFEKTAIKFVITPAKQEEVEE